MFLRSLVRQGQDNQLSQTLVRSLRDAMEELELNAHKEDAMKPDHAHMFLCLSREQQINDLMPYPRSAMLAVSLRTLCYQTLW